MQIENKILKKENIEKLYNKLKADSKIFAPTKDDKNSTVFKYNTEFKDLVFDHIQTVESVKNTVFPKIETLFKYNTVSENGVDIEDVDLSKIQDLVVWGVHPCDASSFGILKSIFMWDIDDEFFKQRLNKLTIVGLSCFKCDENCFCTSVGLNPGSTEGSDILLSPLKDGNFFVEIITEKGKEVIVKNAELFDSVGNEQKDSNLANVEKKFDRADVTKNLPALFDDRFWIKNSLRCIGCGACAYVCPTCACFDIQDVSKGKQGKRIRCWDSCGIELFTKHTSGHNPREYQSQRWRQRIMHKFSYMPERNNSLGCIGCGRCSRACPVDMNILEQLIKISEHKI